MNTVDIHFGKQKLVLPCPETWDDMDDKTAMLFYQTLFENTGDEYTHTAFTMAKLISMVMFLGISKEMLDTWSAACLAQDAEHGELIFLDHLRQVVHAALGGLFEIETTKEGGTTYAVKNNRRRNILPILFGAGTKQQAWYAPADGLDNISLYEMATTFTLYENFMATQNDDDALMLLAAIYRPSRPETKKDRESAWGGDRRQPLRGYESVIETRKARIAEWPILARRFLVFWFASCRQGIIDAYPKVFKVSEGEKSGNDYGWGGVLLALAGGPVGLDSIADQHHGNGLTWLSMKADEAEEYERRMEEMKR